MKITLGILFSLLLVATTVYLLGPRPSHPHYATKMLPIPEIGQLEEYIDHIESLHKIRPDNEAEIVWADSILKRQTEYAVVYLHGYSASKEEGNPVHRYLAKTLKANLYLARLADHGIDTTSAMEYMTADRLWESAKQALQIGERLGKKVIIASTSTGGTLALKLAATYPEVNSLILLSPNIAINDPLAFMLNDPWGLQISRIVMGGKERTLDWRSEAYKKYWYAKYRLESVVQLQELLETTMTRETFQAVKQPVLLLYYYKNEKEQDPVVRVDAMLKMYDELGTPSHLKSKKAIPNAANHVMGSYITSKDLKSVAQELKIFATKISSP
ncbi:alpha/beta hydrolase [Pedobacter psychroterrae]|uniref:Alpha/beta hydrolase n=1 Tax=Pedobacter psychroterrae TaxID=2530453 RepID=A0A4R0NUE8_9SPHI|nr:alpha/beta hydrolase [Pedobacter psychroterrae]TCD03613.1 alpha/beta hydrolase [Pedobacter psychroterrae]